MFHCITLSVVPDVLVEPVVDDDEPYETTSRGRNAVLVDRVEWNAR
jgi:hypothetical protein